MNDEKVIEALQRSLTSSNQAINLSTESVLKGLEDKSMEWDTRERAGIWLQKANKIKKATKEVYDSIESLKLKEGFDNSDFRFIQGSLIEFRSEILNADSSVYDEFSDEFIFINRFITLLASDSLSPTSFNKDITKNSLIATLSSLQNDLKIFENKTVFYCYTKSGSIGDWFVVYTPLVSQNGKHLKNGDLLEIKAGLGFFSREWDPSITVNGEKIPLGEEGYVIYKMKILKSPGKYSVPVKVSYINNLTGKPETWESNVEYTVAKECDQ